MPTRALLAALLGAAVVTVSACGGGDSTSPTTKMTEVAGQPAAISLDPGASIVAAAGSTVPVPISVRDKSGIGVANIQVTLAVSAGGGGVAPVTVTSGPNGQLAGVQWTLGKSAVPQTLTATGAGISSDIAGTIATAYPLDLRFFGQAPQPEAGAAFTDAAARIQGSIVAPLSIVQFADTVNAKICGGPDQTGIGSSAGVIIYASVDSIDGPGKVLARSGPCFVRISNSLPVLGVMQFDKADIAGLVSTGRLASVVLHEMLHVVGVGTIWDSKGYLQGRGTDNPLFTGPLGVSACLDAGGGALCGSGVPLENCVNILNCGAGTQDSHWRENTFDSELMTGFVELPGVAMPFSTITIQSLADFGYKTNSLAADAYMVPVTATSASLQLNFSAASPTVVWEEVIKPLFAIGADRRITRLRQ